MTDTQVTWLTQESYDRLKTELDQLIANRPVIAAEINDRREEGDLRENGGYQAAREEFSHGNPAGAHGAVPGAQPQGTTEPHTTKHRANRGTLLVEGVLTILCGIAVLILPTFIGVLALYIIACWALFKGFGSLMQMRARGVVLAIVGILGVLLFLYIIFNPLHFIRAIFLVVGLFALIAGIMMVMRGFQHNAAARRATRPIEPSY